MRNCSAVRRKPSSASGSEYEWLDGGQKVTIRGNLWYHQYDQVGGDAIDFVRRFYNKLYPEAMEYLLGETGGTLTAVTACAKRKKNTLSSRPRTTICGGYSPIS
ncbi:MAG: hypothetical protein ACLR23_14465 [Clostridia bacterium]